MSIEQQSRRDFLKNSLLATAGATLLTNELWAGPKKPSPRHIGVQLYSVRDAIKIDAKGTLAKIAKMGYKEVEGFGYSDGKFFGLTPADYSKTLADNGLTMPSAHAMVTSKDYAGGQLSDGFKKLVEDAISVGQKYVIAPYMVDEDRLQGKKMAEIFNKAGEYCKAAGVKFGYHNHDFEFKKYNGEQLYTTLLNNTDKHLVTFEMDLYWVVVGGEKPVEWFKKHQGRFTHFHVKDHDPVKNVTVEVGEGDINFQEIFNAAKIAGTKYFVVELENYKRTPMEGIEIGLNNLKKLKF
ncbi:sugar phosphate isomerase/epimerase family protein [Arcicella rigui]|uniref:Sugar phosphate isomerase/epimerase n=1 Tax=Arcicella rigui TaxID=797020 RepID=A0ABU5QAS3_9BACT|nr:sugar phosphate isomerase/epimerase [Arcicella rigui]MEA5139479.1 sugar phosphate isomerase/epimerase [Arcicella rigui]